MASMSDLYVRVMRLEKLVVLMALERGFRIDPEAIKSGHSEDKWIYKLLKELPPPSEIMETKID